jgi:hypothetical protein
LALEQTGGSQVEASHVCAILCDVRHSKRCQCDKQLCQVCFKTLQYQNKKKIEKIATLATPQILDQCLPNCACSLLVAKVNFFAVLEN